MEKKKELIYLIPFIIYCFICLAGGSELIHLSNVVKIILYAIIILFYGVKVLLDKNSVKILILYALIALVCAYAYLKTGTIFFLMNFITIIAIKDVDIKKVVKIDLIIKCIFIAIHSILYVVNYIFNYDAISYLIIASDGFRVRNALFFTHPNIAAGLILWAIIDAFYLLKNIKIKHIIISAIIMVVTYIITGSRTTILIYALFMILYYLNKLVPNIQYKKLLTYGQRYGIEIMTVISLLLAYLYRFGNSFIYLINRLTSGRVYYSYGAIDKFGIHFLSNAQALNVEKFFIVDNFYIRCAVLYGLIFLVFLIIFEKFANKNIEKYRFEKISFIVLCFTLFSEYYGFIIGNAIPLLLLGNMVINKNKKSYEIVKNDLISIIVPVYNVKKYLERCVESLCKQTYDNIEILLIDDGSTDGSKLICDKYASNDKRIKVLHINNSGVSKARNIGLENANGSYITFVDADDYVSETYIEKMYKLCIEEKSDIGIIGIIEFDEATNKKNDSGKSLEFTTNSIEALEEMLNERYYFGSVWGKIYNSELWKGMYFNEKTSIGEDLEILYKIFLKSKMVSINTHERLYYYTKNRNNSATNSEYNDKWKKEIEICENILNDCINSNNKEIFPFALKRYVRINYSCIIKLLKSNHYDEKLYQQLKDNILKYKKYNIYKKFTLIMRIKLVLVLKFENFAIKLLK